MAVCPCPVFMLNIAARACSFRLHRPGDAGGSREQRGADWVYTPPQRGSAAALYAVCASHDGRYLAAGGGDKKVHVWDLRSGEHVQVRPICLHLIGHARCTVSTRPVPFVAGRPSRAQPLRQSRTEQHDSC